jgi:hypothetical protein
VVEEDGTEREVPIFTDEDFTAAGGEIRIPQDPPASEQIVAVFPTVWAAAEAQVVELLALLIAPNSELADADEDGTVEDYLLKGGRRLLHTATLEQLMDLAVAAIEQVVAALNRDGGSALERAMGAVTGTAPRQAQAEGEPQNPTTSSTPESPTGSDGLTDGAAGKPSTTHPGAKSGSASTG